jgi:hypothetical protein
VIRKKPQEQLQTELTRLQKTLDRTTLDNTEARKELSDKIELVKKKMEDFRMITPENQ